MILKYLSFIEMSKICKLSKTISHLKKNAKNVFCFVCIRPSLTKNKNHIWLKNIYKNTWYDILVFFYIQKNSKTIFACIFFI
jgi:hypothetical protein